MKKILLLLLFSNIALAQHHFKIENKNVLWQKIVQDSISPVNFAKGVRTNGDFTLLDERPDEVLFTLKFSASDMEKAGYKRSSDPIFLGFGGYCQGKVEFKDRRYRITIYNIKIDKNPLAAELPVYDYLTRKDEFKTGKAWQRSIDVMDKFFDLALTPKKETSNW